MPDPEPGDPPPPPRQFFRYVLHSSQPGFRYGREHYYFEFTTEDGRHLVVDCDTGTLVENESVD